jgi:uncharacterized protein YggT (Ycf19 family)
VIVLLRVLDVLKWLVIIDAVLSWFVAADRFPRSLTQLVLAPVYAPIHAVLAGKTGSIDLAPLLVLAVLFALQLMLRKAIHDGRR